jgi:hypothetical protein
MDDILSIWNTSLAHLGDGTEIQALNEDSKQARVMRRFYYGLLKSLISSKNWFWATIFQQLTLVSIYPTPEWPYAYAYPSNCLRLTRLWNWHHTDDIDNYVQYLKVNNGTQKIIVSEYGDASVLAGTPFAPIQPTPPITVDPTQIPVAQFVAYTDNVGLYPEMFKQALAFILAAYAAPSLPGVGQEDLRKSNLELGNAALNQALADDMNESRQYTNKKSIIEKAGAGDFGYWANGAVYSAYNAGNFNA